MEEQFPRWLKLNRRKLLFRGSFITSIDLVVVRSSDPVSKFSRQLCPSPFSCKRPLSKFVKNNSQTLLKCSIRLFVFHIRTLHKMRKKLTAACTYFWNYSDSWYRTNVISLQSGKTVTCLMRFYSRKSISSLDNYLNLLVSIVMNVGIV